jgi:hypothetical protein
MIEGTLTVMASLELAAILFLWARIQAVERILTSLSLQAKDLELPPVDEYVSIIKEDILDTISEMRPPSAIDHIAGVWSQIMMMREQVKLAKEGLIAPGAVHVEPEPPLDS